MVWSGTEFLDADDIVWDLSDDKSNGRVRKRLGKFDGEGDPLDVEEVKSAVGSLFEQYVRSLSGWPEFALLNREEEAELAARIKRWDPAARSRMITANLRLVISIAKDYAHYGMELMDLINEGNIGLMKAAERFDPKKGKFSTYASWWIKQSIKLALADKSRTVSLTPAMAASVRKMKKVVLKLTEEFWREPESHEIRWKLGMKRQKFKNVMHADTSTASFDAPMGDNGVSLLHLHADPNAEDPLSQLMESDNRRNIDGLLGVLDNRERKVIDARFWLNGQKPRTLVEVGQEFGVTRERIRQIQNIAMKKLRAALEKREDETVIAAEQTKKSFRREKPSPPPIFSKARRGKVRKQAAKFLPKTDSL